MNVLVVTNPFGGRGIGERITDPAEIESALSGEHARHVVASDHAGQTPAPKANTTKED